MSRPWFSATATCAGLRANILVALLPIGSAQAVPVYRGFAQAIDYSHPIEQSGGTTTTPMTYTAALSGIQATSQTHSANGGSAEVMASAATNSGAGANAQISYRVYLIGPVGVYVPIRFVAAGSVDATILGPGSGYAADTSFIVNFSTATENRISGYAVLNLGRTGSFAVDQTVRVYGGSFFDVQLEVSAGAGAPGGDPSAAHAFVDPVFTIDPEFAALYRLEGIPGFDAVDPTPPTIPPPSSAVTEPGTWTIVLLGSSLLAYARRRGPIAAVRQRSAIAALPLGTAFFAPSVQAAVISVGP